MATVLDAIRACSRELLAQVRSRADEETLMQLVAEREEQIRLLSKNAAGRQLVSRSEVEALLALDLEVAEALRSRRDALWQELAALRQARSAESAYRHDAAAPSRFLDRET